MLQQEWGRSVKCDQSENGMARRAGGDRVIEFPYLVMFRNEHGHFVSVDVMEAVELYEPKESNK